MKKFNKIVFIHSLNNYTGSPNVLSTVIEGFVTKGYKVKLITSRSEGFLSNLSGVEYHFTCYKWYNEPWKTAILLFLSQTIVFFKILLSENKSTLYYLNTITPFGAALACRISGKKFVYHVHENMKQSKPVYIIFRTVYRLCNRKSIFVSRYLESTALGCRDGVIVYNSLNKSFAERIRSGSKVEDGKILMVSSLRKYKGVYEFIELARRLSHLSFQLVLSASKEEVSDLKLEAEIPFNMEIASVQKNLAPFYENAWLLMQLSHPNEWVETFGMSILEAMAYGIPAIVPNIGGPAELISDGKNGFLVDPLNIDDVQSKIEILLKDQDLYSSFSLNARLKYKEYNNKGMIEKIERYLLQ